MDKWEPLIDRMIREAMDRGEFDELAGTGQPVDLSENPYEDPELRTVHRLLRNAGFAPAWIEERKDIEAVFQQAYATLCRAKNLFCSPGSDSPHDWLRAAKEFRDCVDELNERIRHYNLKVPAMAFQRKIIDVDKFINELKERPT